MNRHNEKLSYRNIDYYFPLLQKRKLLKKISGQYFTGKLLDVGCGEMPYKEIILNHSKVEKYIGLDIENHIYQNKIRPDVLWDGEKIPLEDSSIDCCLLIEVLEHLPSPYDVFLEINRVLKPNGIIFITVPFLWPLHDVPNDEYRYTPFSLSRLLKTTKLEIVSLDSSGGWNAALAMMIGLYLRRGTNSRLKKLMSIISVPLLKFLYKKDESYNKTEFTESQMITGLFCIATKI